MFFLRRKKQPSPDALLREISLLEHRVRRLEKQLNTANQIPAHQPIQSRSLGHQAPNEGSLAPWITP